MRWQRGYQSRDVIDRRGEGGRGGGGIGSLLPLILLLLRHPIGWVILLVLGGLYLLGGRGSLLTGGEPGRGGGPREQTAQDGRAVPDETAQFVSFVLDDAQRTFAQAVAARGKAYRPAKLVLFTDATRTGCGAGRAIIGPFYCPADERVYIDLGFFRELSSRLGARGDFAQAFVIAHELGHHVQNVLGASDRDRGFRGPREGATGESVRTELQADCFAGVWASSANERQILDPGDIEEAMSAAAAVGDDRLQRQSSGVVQPESWTHGSSAQRAHWFHVGYETGNIDACDTFSTGKL